MAQLSLVDSVFTPDKLQLTVWNEHLARTPTTTLQVVAYGRLNAHSAGASTSWTGVMPDLLPDAACAALEAYMYGNKCEDVISAVRRIHEAATAHNAAHRRNAVRGLA
jgi:hypothetical protein